MGEGRLSCGLPGNFVFRLEICYNITFVIEINCLQFLKVDILEDRAER